MRLRRAVRPVLGRATTVVAAFMVLGGVLQVRAYAGAETVPVAIGAMGARSGASEGLRRVGTGSAAA